MYKLLIIDLDDTIVNYTSAHKTAFDNAINYISEQCNYQVEDIISTHTRVKKELYEKYDKRYNRHDKFLQFKLLCNQLKITHMATIQKIYEIYENTYLNNIKLHENCIEFLQLCNSKNMVLCIMSNNLLDIQLKVCIKLELDKFINGNQGCTLFTSHEFTYEKPHEEPLEYILNYYNVKKEEVLIVGDSISNDIDWGVKNNIATFLCDHTSPDTSFESCIRFINQCYSYCE